MLLHTQQECCWVHFKKESTFFFFAVKWKSSHLGMEYSIQNNQLNCPYPYWFEGNDLLVLLPRSTIVDVLKKQHALSLDDGFVLRPSYDFPNKIVYLTHYFLLDAYTWNFIETMNLRLGSKPDNNVWVIYPE